MKITASHFAAALSCLIVAYGSSAVITYQAAAALGANARQIASWFTVLAFFSGALTLWATLRYKAPITYVWSTPGAAVLAAMSGVALPDAAAGFILSGLLMFAISAAGLFGRMMQLIPAALASAMLAGVLLKFGMGIFTAMEAAPFAVILMLAVYLAVKIFAPRYAVLAMLTAGLSYAAFTGSTAGIHWQPPRLEWVTPSVSNVPDVLSVALPLFMATLASQNITGMAVLRAYGYGNVPAGKLVSASSLVTIFAAPLGAFNMNLAAISAAICMDGQVDKDPAKRWPATVLLAGFFFTFALLGGMIVSLFTALPQPVLAAIAGISILAVLQHNLIAVFADEPAREAALITLLTSASGMQLFGIGSAFWGLVLGFAVYHLNLWAHRRK